MYVRKTPFTAVGLFAVWLACGFTAPGAEKEEHGLRDKTAVHGPAVLWIDPVDIASRNLFYGPGGSSHVPSGPFTFVKEDLDGSNPKFVVKDRDGVKWKVKLGIEARPETVASRLLWAAGYYADENYFMTELQVRGMPTRLHRGQKLVGPDGSVRNARLKRENPDVKKIGHWRWRSNAFTGTRELNGLRILMALINNWDLKDVNTAVYQGRDCRFYTVSDLGASFSCAGRCWPRSRTKGDLEKYAQSAFIRRIDDGAVSVQSPARPRFVYLVSPLGYWRRTRMEWIGKDIPLADARWMGKLLARLSAEQIRDAFRAAGYAQPEADQFSAVVARRIAALTDL